MWLTKERRSALVRFAFGWLLLVACLGTAHARGNASTLDFGGTTYEHRWSKDGQNEYTPSGQEDLAAWQDMVTLVVNKQVVDAETLAGLANGVLANYKASGVVVRTASVPATPERPAEHLVAAMLKGNGVVEATFARFVLHEGKGVIVIRMHRAHGEDAAARIGAWVEENGEAVERELMAWGPLPSIAALAALPQTP